MINRNSFHARKASAWLPAALIFILGLFMASSAAVAGVGLQKKVDAHLKSRFGNFSGFVLVARKGDILVSKGYGMANYELGVPNTAKTKFRLGSLTKQFTAAAILQLREKGLLDLNDSLSKYLPDYPHGEQIFLHHLLAHTSGIPSYTDFPGFLDNLAVPTTVEKVIASFKGRPLVFSPGQKFSYSNSGYVLLGCIIEKVSGQSYEDYLRDNIFTPLGMKDTGYDHTETVLQNRAAGYRYLNGKQLCNAGHMDMANAYSAGALYSTAEDLYLWDRALYTEKVLSRESLTKMFAPGLGAYGYGWYIGQVSGRRVVHHGGNINGFSTYVARYIDDDVLVVVLSNIERAPIAQISWDLGAIAFGQ